MTDSAKYLDVFLKGRAIVFCLLTTSCALNQNDQGHSEMALTTRQVMNWVLDPNADLIWNSAGFEITADGVEDLAPASDEQWLAVRNSSAAIIEVGNILLMPTHYRDDAAWSRWVRDLQSTGMQLLATAESRDSTRLFSLGGELFEACQSCHDHYITQ